MDGSQIAMTAGASSAHVIDLPLGRASAMRFAPGAALARHQHAQAMVAVIVSGGFAGTYGDRDHDILPAWVVVEPAGELHANRFGKTPTRILTLSLAPIGLTPAVESLGRELRWARDPICGAIARRACTELERPDELTPLAVESEALELLTRLGRSARDDGRPPWLAEARGLLHDRYSDPLRLGEVASLVGVEPGRLARTCRRAFGEPMAAYLRRLRVSATAARLSDSDEPISRIAVDVGFADQSHLTRSFARLLGTTPARFRGHAVADC